MAAPQQKRGAAAYGIRLWSWQGPVKPPDQAGKTIPRGSALNGHKVDRREFPSSVDLEVELEAIAFVDTRQPRAFDRADMDEGVFLAIVTRDEAEAFHRIEELDRPGGLLPGELALRAGGLL